VRLHTEQQAGEGKRRQDRDRCAEGATAGIESDPDGQADQRRQHRSPAAGEPDRDEKRDDRGACRRTRKDGLSMRRQSEREHEAQGGEDPACVRIAERLEEKSPLERVSRHVSREEIRDEPGTADGDDARECSPERRNCVGASQKNKSRPDDRHVDGGSLERRHRPGCSAGARRLAAEPRREGDESHEHRPPGAREPDPLPGEERNTCDGERSRRRPDPGRRGVAARGEGERRDRAGRKAERHDPAQGREDGDPPPRPEGGATAR
jgi:hypothetical protein